MKKGYIYIVLAAFIFSTMEIAGKVIADEINPYELTFLRFLIGGLVLLPLTIKEIRKRKIKIDSKEIIYFMMMGLLCVVLSMSLFQIAVLNTKASTVAILFSTNPMFTIPFAYLILKENINKKVIASLMVSFIGILFILNPTNSIAAKDFKGIIFAVLSAITFSLYSVLGKKKIKKYGGLAFNCIAFLVGDILMTIFMLIIKKPFFAGITTGNILDILYLGVVVSGLGYLFYFYAMEETSATTGSIVFFIKPALAPILSLILIGEKIPIATVFGILLILLGSFMTMLSKRTCKVALPKTIDIKNIS